MQWVKATIGKDKYKTLVKSDTNMLIADEPKEVGGSDLGFSPDELLASSLAVCTVVTVRMYADRKHWKLDGVEVTVTIQWDKEHAQTQMRKEILLKGDLLPEERQRLLEISERCPTHKMLQNPINIKTIAIS
jgi:putative redox protein